MSHIYTLIKLVLSIGGLLLLSSCEVFTENIVNDENSDKITNVEDIAYIEMGNYPEWNCGIVDSNESYLFLKQDSETNEYVVYINSNKIECDGVVFYFDENQRIKSLVTENGVCNILWTDNSLADIHIITDETDKYVKDISIEYPEEIIETRVVAWIPVLLNVARGISAILTAKGAIDLINNLMTGDLISVTRNVIELIAMGKLPKKFKEFFISIGYEGLKKLKSHLDERGRKSFLGNCEISITYKKVGVNVYDITMSVTGYETLPIVADERCVVYAGVAVRKGYPYITYFNHDDIIGEFEVNGNGTKTITYELPEDSTYYAIPYLLPTRAGMFYFTPYTRYGNTIRLENFNGDIDSFNQLSYTKQDQIITFNCTAHATCNVEKDQRWNLYYENDLGYKTFYNSRTYDEPSISNPNTADFDFQIDFHASNIVNGQKEIKLGLAIFNENNYLIIASEPEIYTLSYEPMTLNSISYKNDYYYYYDDEDGANRIGYHCTANISGNTTAIENFGSCGIYLYDSISGKSYKWYENLSGNYNNENIDFYIGVHVSIFENIDYARYYAELKNVSFGVYVEYNDGTYYLSEPKPCTFVYNREPSFKYLSVGSTSVSVIDSYEDDNGETRIQYSATHPYSYAIDGALWIEYIQSIVEGEDWYFTDTGEQYSEPWYPSSDWKYDSTRTSTYWSGSNISRIIYNKIVTKGGNTVYSNSLVYGGSPEHPTVSIGGARTSSAIEKYHSKVYNSKANTTSCGYCDGMAISDIEINKNKVMTIDDLKEIPTNKVIH